MSAKNMIQNLQDSQLIRIFLDFVQTYHLQYQKIDKEISYKCHQATWILASTKATGYGRTQSQAYKHALRNLLQILIQDPPYRQFFANLLAPNSNSNTNSSANTNTLPNSSYSKFNQSGITNMRSQNLNNKQKPVAANNNKSQLYSHLSASLASNPSNNNVTNKRQLKTQAMQPQQQIVDLDKYNQIGTGHKYQKNDMGNKMVTNSKGSYASSYKCMGYQGYPPYPQSSSTSKKQSYTKTNMANMTNMNKSNINNSNYQASGQTSQSSLIMQKQSYPQQISNAKTKHLNNYQQQLKQALIKNKQLCEQLDKINKQNQILRNKIYAVGRQNNNNSSVNNLNISASHHNINQNAYHNQNTSNNGNTVQNNKGMRLSVGGHHHNTSATYLQTGASHIKAYSHTNINLNTSTHSNANNTTNVSIMNVSNTMNSIQKIKNNTNSQNTSNVIPASTHLNIMRDITNNINTVHHTQAEQDKNTGNMNSEQTIKPRPSISTNKSKVQVPKLKLQILPNYHKKAQKSLNDSLLAVYQQKHGVSHTSADITGVSSMVGGINVNVSVNNFKKVM